MLLKKITCLLLAFVSFCSLKAQDKTADSLQRLVAVAKEDTGRVQLLYSLSDLYSTTQHYNLDSALLYTSQGMELSKKIDYKNGEITGLLYSSYSQVDNGKPDVAKQLLFTALDTLNKFIPQNLELKLRLYKELGILYSESNFDSSIYYFTRLFQLAQTTQNYSQEAIGAVDIGYEFLLLGNYPEAMKLCIRGEQIAEKNNDILDEAILFRRRGDVYFFENDAKHAIYYYNLAGSLATKLNNMDADKVLDVVHLSKARAYLKWNILDSALFYAKQYYEVSEKTHYNIGMSRMLNVLGNVYEKLGKDSIAYNYFQQGISISLSQNIVTSAVQTYNNLAQYFYNKQQIDSCIFYANKAVEITHGSGFLLYEPETYTILSNAYLAKRNIDSTFKYMHLTQAVKDSLLGIDKIEQMQLSVFNEEQEKKQQDAEQLAYKNTIRFYALLVGIIALFLVAGLLWRNNRIKQKAYSLLQKQKAETDLQRDKANKALVELRSTQSQLIQSEKMASLGELTAGIAHEIQNPLNFVNNFSEVNKELVDELQDELKAGNTEYAMAISNDIKENEEKINHHGKRADAIVKGMLQHSRSSSGVKEPTNINALADEYLRLAYHGLRAKNKSFNATTKTGFDNTIETINIVPQDIGRAILNLITNAFYAVTEKQKQIGDSYEPTVIISTKKINDKIEISVKDNGNGIPQKVVDKIFQPFFTTKPTGEGTGLGLSLSYDIVKAHGGEIKVETKEGEGTEFIIQLPINS